MTDYIKSCLPTNGQQEIISEISNMKPHQIQELDRWLKKIESDWRKVELLRVTAREDGGFEVGIQSGTYFPDI